MTCYRIDLHVWRLMVRFFFLKSTFNAETFGIKMAHDDKVKQKKKQMEAVHAELKVSLYFTKFSPQCPLKSTFNKFWK